MTRSAQRSTETPALQPAFLIENSLSQYFSNPLLANELPPLMSPSPFAKTRVPSRLLRQQRLFRRRERLRDAFPNVKALAECPLRRKGFVAKRLP